MIGNADFCFTSHRSWRLKSSSASHQFPQLNQIRAVECSLGRRHQSADGVHRRTPAGCPGPKQRRNEPLIACPSTTGYLVRRTTLYLPARTTRKFSRRERSPQPARGRWPTIYLHHWIAPCGEQDVTRTRLVCCLAVSSARRDADRAARRTIRSAFQQRENSQPKLTQARFVCDD